MARNPLLQFAGDATLERNVLIAVYVTGGAVKGE
jgi:hypothetical protein